MKSFYKIFLLNIILFLSLGVFIEPALAAEEKQSSNCMTEEQCVLYGQQHSVSVKLRKGAGGCTGGTGLCLVNIDNIKLNVPIPGKGGTVSSIEQYIKWLFQFLVGASGVVAVAMIVLGGYTYITAAGNQSRVTKAKEYIVDALVGMALIFGSVIFLGQINSRLVDSEPLAVEVIKSEALSKEKFCKDPIGTGDEQAACGEITTEQDGGASCRSGYCPESGQVCLPVTIGGVNNLKAYKCYDSNAESLQQACEEAPEDECETIDDAIKDASPPDDDGCAKMDDGCGYGTLLDCSQSSYSNRKPCSVCGGYKVEGDSELLLPPDEYYCEDPGKEVIGWRNSGFISDSWGAICCAQFTNKQSSGPIYGDAEMWSANGRCGVRFKDNKPTNNCDD